MPMTRTDRIKFGEFMAQFSKCGETSGRIAKALHAPATDAVHHVEVEVGRRLVVELGGTPSRSPTTPVSADFPKRENRNWECIPERGGTTIWKGNRQDATMRRVRDKMFGSFVEHVGRSIAKMDAPDLADVPVTGAGGLALVEGCVGSDTMLISNRQRARRGERRALEQDKT
jgi:hypothetical protein